MARKRDRIGEEVTQDTENEPAPAETPIETAAPPIEAAPPSDSERITPIPDTVAPAKRGPRPALLCGKGHRMKDPTTGKVVRDPAMRPEYCMDCEGERKVDPGAAVIPDAPATAELTMAEQYAADRKRIAEHAPMLESMFRGQLVLPMKLIGEYLVADLNRSRIMYPRTTATLVGCEVVPGNVTDALARSLAEFAAYYDAGQYMHPLMVPVMIVLGISTAVMLSRNMGGAPVDLTSAGEAPELPPGAKE